MNKIIAVDFDGTLVSDAYPNIGEPDWKLINWCKERQRRGDKLILWTCRTDEDLDNALAACTKFGLTFDAVNSNIPDRIQIYENDCRKVGADIYIDDKAMTPSHVYNLWEDTCTDTQTLS